MGDHRIDFDLAGQIFFDIAGQLRAAFYSTKRGAAPHPAGDQLERTRADFLAGAGHADDHGFTPALMATFQRSTHGFDIADTLERIIHTTIGHFDNHLLNRTAVGLGHDEISRAETFCHFEFRRVHVNGDNPFGPRHDQTLTHAQANAAEAENSRSRTWSYFGRVQDRADPCGDAATQ